MKLDRLTFRLLLAQSADVLTFLTFYLVIGAAIHSERNVILLLLMAIGGIWAVAAIKLGITALVCWRASKPLGHSRFGVIRRFHERHPRVVAFHLRFRVVLISAATASGIVGAGFNLASIIH